MLYYYLICWAVCAFIIAIWVFYDFQMDETEPFEIGDDVLCSFAVGAILGAFGPFGLFLCAFLTRTTEEP
ncbi:hypothetical protein JIN84_12830 [Luteolibacter yonseiensis]|uniref:Uncharacterized protein n=1 Tax=Luteolibacter yonseiensis TaxID=1144680 RepID=A0A934VAS6_9BACT|nr:hypothetical protein [Luteolibacter yonseiensis]MBK1816503.1 hypothetical protein [Luteolibacter yonseiensis]